MLRNLFLLALFVGCVGSDQGEPDDDFDGDGFVASADCDDRDPRVHPGGLDPYGDDIDGDCNGMDGVDADGDGFAADPGPDCDDTDPQINPDATDEPYDGVDANCDQDYYAEYDTDHDNYRAVEAGGNDCDDRNAAVNPGADERCNGIDDDCDDEFDEADALGSRNWYLDGDGDGYGAGEPVRACYAPGDDWVVSGLDCDDEEPLAHPSMDEICGDGIDNDCDGGPGLGCGLYTSGAASDVGIAWTINLTGFRDGLFLADLSDDGETDLAVYGDFGDHVAAVAEGPLDAGGTLDASYPSVEWSRRAESAVAADLDGNGTVELLFGVPYSYRGVYLVEGDFSADVAAEDVVHVFSDGGDGFGQDVMLTDRNGDATPDLVVIDRNTYPGERYLLALDGPIEEGMVPGDASFTVTCDEGWSGLDLIDDFDGGGAPGVVVFGGGGTDAESFSMAEDGAVSCAGLRYGSELVASVGDVTGDGYDDVLIDDFHSSWLQPGPFADQDTWDIEDGIELTAADGAAGGDLDADGMRDLVLGDSYGAGRVYVYFGPITGSVTADLYVTDAGGVDLEVVDVDGDGWRDVASVSSTRASIYLLWGGPGL